MFPSRNSILNTSHLEEKVAVGGKKKMSCKINVMRGMIPATIIFYSHRPHR